MLAQSVSLFDEATRQRGSTNLVHYFLTLRRHRLRQLAWHKAVVAIGSCVHRQAYTLAFGDVFFLLGVALLVALPGQLAPEKAGACRGGKLNRHVT